MTERESIIHFATTNRHKFREASNAVAPFGIRLKRLNVEKLEIQANSLTAIVTTAANEFIKNRVARAVITDDSGIFIHSLNGFPGPYSSFVFETLGSKGILRLLEHTTNREAYFQAAVAYCAIRCTPVSFTGIVKGSVSREPKGNFGFGYDPIFIPKSGDGRTFGEMSIAQKNRLSHRAKAFSNFCKWYTTHKFGDEGKLNNRTLRRREQSLSGL